LGYYFSFKKLRKIKLLFLNSFFFFLLVHFFISTPLHSSKKKIKVGVFNLKPICNTRNIKEDGGFLVKILKHIAEKEKLKLTYIPINYNQGLKKLKNNEVDIIATTVLSPEKDELLSFTKQPILSIYSKFYTNKNKRIKSISNLKSIKLGILQNDPYKNVLKKFIKLVDIDCSIIEFSESIDLFNSINNNKVDAVALNNFYKINKYQKRNINETSIIFPPVEIHYAALKEKNQDLIKKINSNLSILKASKNSLYYSILNDISGKNNGYKISIPIICVSIIIFAIFILLFIMNLSLRKKLKNKTEEINQKSIALKKKIQERKSIVDSLRESEEKFRSISDQSLMAIAIIQDGFIRYANKAFYELSGYTLENIEQWNEEEYRKLIHPEDASYVMKQSKLKQTGVVNTPEYFSYRILTKDYKIKWVNQYSRVINFKGETAELMTLIDITGIKEAEKKIAAQKERLAVTLRSIGDGVITTNPTGKILLMNKIAENITGWKQEDALFKPICEIFRIIDEEKENSFIDPVQKVMQSGEITEKTIDNKLLSKDGSEKIILYSCAPIRDKDKRIIGTILVFHDITEDRMMEKELMKAQKLESLGVLAGGIAHDFKNLLTIIIGNISLSKHFLKNEKVNILLKKAEQGANRAISLSQQLMTFSKGSVPIKKTVSISGIIEDMAKFSLTGSPSKCLFEIPDNLYPVDIDKDQISQVFQNLIINADQAMKNGGTIKIEAENLENGSDFNPSLKQIKYVKISITDEGTGIKSEYLDKIFDPFFTMKDKGNGLGLSIVYSIIQKHDGYITVKSEFGEGTTFNVFLPASEKKVISEHKEKEILYKGKGKILIMDDEEEILELIGAILETLGYESYFAMNGKQAIKKYEEKMNSNNPFDAVILDLTIPGGMGGKETIKRLLKIDPSVKAIVSSGYSNDPVISDFIDFGFKAAIRKPFKIEKLSKVLNELINK